MTKLFIKPYTFDNGHRQLILWGEYRNSAIAWLVAQWVLTTQVACSFELFSS